VQSVEQIVGYGTVNAVYIIATALKEYVIRLNEEAAKLIEYKKERWCLQRVKQLGIPTAEVYAVGVHAGHPYIIQSRVAGTNGKDTQGEQRNAIWKRLGEYARIYQRITRVEDEEVKVNLLHRTWKERLDYNIAELAKENCRLRTQVLSKALLNKAVEVLERLTTKQFGIGLVHGDLHPRNVLIDEEKISLIDWGTAEINIVPHIEIGIIQMSKDVSTAELEFFTEGLGVADLSSIQLELNMINFLHRLDKYRWAEDNHVPNLADYTQKVVDTLSVIN